MAPSATFLSIADFDKLYAAEPGWEYWFGEARRKPVPTKFHGILQNLLADLLRWAGYIAIVESDLRIVNDWRPRPDVYGVLKEFEGAYPTRPVDVVFEVLSDDDDVLTKCKHYTEIQIPAVFVFDPAAQTIDNWDGTKLVSVTDVKLGNGVTITGVTIWREFVRRQLAHPPASMTI
jgi:Uma2 family endonuclease